MQRNISKKMHNITVVTVIAALLSCLLLMPVLKVKAAGNAKPLPLKTISLSAKSYIKLKQAYMLSGAHANTLSFTLTIHNGDAVDMDFLDYWVRLFTKAGTIYYPKLITADLSKKRIAANSNEDYTFYATVGATVKLQDISFKAIKWDFKKPGFMNVLGEITLPNDYSPAVPSSAKQTIESNGTALTAYVKKSTLQQADEVDLLTLTLALENIGTKNAPLSDFNYSILTAEGVEYPLESKGLNTGTQLAPKIAKDIEWTATLPKNINPENWKLLVTSTEAESKLALPILLLDLTGVIQQDASSSAVETGIIEIDKQTITASVYEWSQTDNDDDGYATTLHLNLENTGSKKVTIPSYQFLLRTQEGLTYPLIAAGIENITINPKQKKEIMLTVTLPTSIDMDLMKLEIYEPVASGTDASDRKRIGTYLLPQKTSIAGSIDKPILYTNKYGTYDLSLTAVQRLPWLDQDQLMAEVSLINKTASSLPIPVISAYYLIDGTVKVEAKVIQPENALGVDGQSQLSLIVIGTLPYTSQFNDVKLILQEQADNQTLTSIGEFSYTSELIKQTQLKSTESYELMEAGRKAKITLNRVSSYLGSNSDLVYTELQMVNSEKRFTSLARLSGYYKTVDERYYPAVVSDVQQSISPNGSVLLSFWSKMPKGVKTKDLQLVLGEAITGNKITGINDKPDGLINAVVFQLPEENNQVNGSLSQVDISPYSVTMSKMNATLGTNVGDILLSFNYRLEKKNEAYEAYPDGHKLIVEFEAGSEKFSESLELEPNQGGKGLQLGQANTYQMTFKDPTLLTKISIFNNYTIRLYDEFQGYRKLLATRSFNWFAVSD
jgi:hypothetical protein